MLIFLISIITATIPYWFPKIFIYISDDKLRPANSWLPMVAGILFAVAFFLPDVHISKETTTFQQHFVGGGMYSACLFAYFKQAFNWRHSWIGLLIFLFAWTSALGVANELLEFSITKLQLTGIDTTDADWDLLANTLGAFFGYAILWLWFRSLVRRE